MQRTAVLVSILALLLGAPALAANVRGTSLYRNCTVLHKHYPHGVGRIGARDKTKGTPVTNFRRSNRLYRLNKGLDRDKDGIACEQA